MTCSRNKTRRCVHYKACSNRNKVLSAQHEKRDKKNGWQSEWVNLFVLWYRVTRRATKRKGRRREREQYHFHPGPLITQTSSPAAQTVEIAHIYPVNCIFCIRNTKAFSHWFEIFGLTIKLWAKVARCNSSLKLVLFKYCNVT